MKYRVKIDTSKSHKDEELASEYRFDYQKAKPNRFAEKMNLNVGWTVERFVAEEKKEPSRKAQGTSGKTRSPKGRKEVAKKSAPAKKSAAKKPATKAKPQKGKPKSKKK